MHLSRKGATNGIPIWLLAVTIGLVIFRVALWAGHSQQVSLKFVNWRPYTELHTVARAQTKPLLLYFVGDGSPKTQMMEDIVFSNRMVAACILNDFYPIVVPGANQFEGEQRRVIRKLYKKYMVVQVPSLVVTSPLGTEVSHTNGFKPSAQTYQFLKTVKEGPKLKEVEESDKIPTKSADYSDDKRGSDNRGADYHGYDRHGDDYHGDDREVRHGDKEFEQAATKSLFRF